MFTYLLTNTVVFQSEKCTTYGRLFAWVVMQLKSTQLVVFVAGNRHVRLIPFHSHRCEVVFYSPQFGRPQHGVMI